MAVIVNLRLAGSASTRHRAAPRARRNRPAPALRAVGTRACVGSEYPRHGVATSSGNPDTGAG